MSEQQHDRDLDPVSLENQRRMAYDRSKWLQTSTHEIAKYEYTMEELKQFFNELLDVMGRVKSKFGCSLCGTFPKKSFVVPCGNSHVFCAKCASRSWNKEGQAAVICPKCKAEGTERATPFFAMDTLAAEINLFSKESKYFLNANYFHGDHDSKETTKRLRSMNFLLLQRLKNIESQLMCDFCFNRLNQTFLINCASEAPTFRPFCECCDEKYIRFYEKEQGRLLRPSFRFEIFDGVVDEFYEFLDKMVDFSKSSKVPVRFMAPNKSMSFVPIYKMILGFILVGIVMMYLSS